MWPPPGLTVGEHNVGQTCPARMTGYGARDYGFRAKERSDETNVAIFKVDFIVGGSVNRDAGHANRRVHAATAAGGKEEEPRPADPDSVSAKARRQECSREPFHRRHDARH